MKKTKYYIHWEYGLHHVMIKTTKRDFYNLIDNIVGEFDIHKIRTKITYADESSITYTDYKIQNYCGDFEIIGRTKTVEKGESETNEETI